MKRTLISIDITCFNYKVFIDKILNLALQKRSAYICVANVHMLVEAYKDPAFATVVNNAEFTTPDGMPLAKGLELLYGIKQDRVAGMDLLPDLLKESEQDAIPVFFYGGTQEMLDKTAMYCMEKYPALKIAGLHSPPFRQLTVQEEQETIRMINDSGAGFVFVALGCPKQEKWMAAMKGEINSCMIGIGGALPVMIGLQKRAPAWMQKASLEWLYRLIQEPKRLFRRYAITNTMFLYLLLKTWASQGFRAAKTTS